MSKIIDLSTARKERGDAELKASIEAAVAALGGVVTDFREKLEMYKGDGVEIVGRPVWSMDDLKNALANGEVYLRGKLHPLWTVVLNILEVGPLSGDLPEWVGEDIAWYNTLVGLECLRKGVADKYTHVLAGINRDKVCRTR